MSLVNLREMGGYFELDLKRGVHFHSEALALNSARNFLNILFKRKRQARFICRLTVATA